jgi:hypothetical protein
MINAKKANPWQAPPITHLETGYIMKEKTNEDVGPNKLKITFKTSASLKKTGASYVKIKF